MPPATHLAELEAFNQRARSRGWPFACAPALDFERCELGAALALWREKARGRAMPARTDMTARAMKPYMTHMSLLERVPAGEGHRYRVRLHGSTLARYSGDGTGKFLEDVVQAERVAGYAAVYDLVLELLQPLRVLSSYQAPEISYLTGESLVAPLALAGSDMPLILSVTYPKPRAERAAGALRHA
ncbi:MAG TPA: PAS domain-containing protein [Rhizomicrobium sp.]|jgi:hypothetical protein|nr:PAS domain-containing protein [Rhizomicrobium sp.]